MAGFDENGGQFPYTTESVRQVLFAPSPPDRWTGGDEKRNEQKRKLEPFSMMPYEFRCWRSWDSARFR
jgi:hypothetical protein